MKALHIDNRVYTDGNLFDEVESIINRLNNNALDIELFGVDLYADELPDDYTLVNYMSRETLAICKDGDLITDREEIENIEDSE